MKILFHGTNAIQFRDGFEAGLAAPHAHSIQCVTDDLDKPGELQSFASADVIIGIRLRGGDPQPAALRLYQAPAAGTDAIDAACLPSRAALCNCFGHEAAIAEYVFAALLARHVPLIEADRQLRRGQWDFWAGRPGALRSELGATTLGLIGFGHIGRMLAERGRAFGMKVRVMNRSQPDPALAVERYFPMQDREAFMASADYIVVTLPLLDSTRGLVGARELRAMRPGAVIVNVGRGAVIDEAALYEALRERRIGGAIIDTWYRYPAAGEAEAEPSHFAFRDLDNVVMTPHMSGWTAGTVRRRQQAMAENINRLDAGQPLINVVRAPQA
ncbi:MAG: phosphoglycerate dehydrogenase [Hyphomicrobiales bacterium]|nr:phosphoglycerate dehydrogenase [Hyphomicrobiales bacterium]